VGGPLHVARDRQGAGRHDNPDRYGALYLSGLPESAVAERIQGLRGQVLTNLDFRRRDGSRLALAVLDDSAVTGIVDLDDPSELARRDVRPSQVATRKRDITQPMALSLYRERVPGFSWWSTLEATWANTTLFVERVARRLRAAAEPELLSVDHPAVRAAADVLGVRLG
jgi:hypothetical protein